MKIYGFMCVRPWRQPDGDLGSRSAVPDNRMCPQHVSIATALTYPLVL